jgi:multidrug efflux pump subunit AcrA (membrane-fusion protein)
VTLPQYSDKTFKSTIATTSSAINMTARTLLVELHADNPDGMLQPGAYAQVKFNLSADPSAVVRIPTSALMFREDGLQVAVLGPGDKVELQGVTLGPILGTEVEVVKGLSASDRVINSPPDSLAAGDVVRFGEPSPPPEESAANASQVE